MLMKLDKTMKNTVPWDSFKEWLKDNEPTVFFKQDFLRKGIIMHVWPNVECIIAYENTR